MAISTTKKSKNVKIVFSGLDGAGKSSMLIVLKKMYAFEDDLVALKPTIMIDHYTRGFLSYVLDFWDMGGQEKFRERYLQRKVYFEEIDCFLYLIDVSDSSRIIESIDYLSKIIELLHEMTFPFNEKSIFICFTKMDYDAAFSERPEYIVNLAKARKLLMEKHPKVPFEFFSTSIYNTYSIVKIISLALMKSLPGYSDLLGYLEEFATKNNFNQIILFDSTGLIIGDYMNSLKNVDRNSIDKIISENLAFYRKIENNNEQDTFRGFKSMRGELMNIGYQFKLDKNSNTPSVETFYLSIILDPEVGKKGDWKIIELIEKLRVSLKSYK